MRLLSFVIAIALPVAASAQTFQVCTNYPNAVQQDLLDAKTQLLETYNLKASTTNAQAQAFFVVLGIRAMLEAKVKQDGTATERAAFATAQSNALAAVLQRLAALQAAFPNPAPPGVCGDSVVDPAEVCDDGPGGVCNDTCTGNNP